MPSLLVWDQRRILSLFKHRKYRKRPFSQRSDQTKKKLEKTRDMNRSQRLAWCLQSAYDFSSVSVEVRGYKIRNVRQTPASLFFVIRTFERARMQVILYTRYTVNRRVVASCTAHFTDCTHTPHARHRTILYIGYSLHVTTIYSYAAVIIKHAIMYIDAKTLNHTVVTPQS